jgi:hypothetical protein
MNEYIKGCIIYQPATYSTNNCPVVSVSKILLPLEIKDYIQLEITGSAINVMEEFKVRFKDIEFPDRLLLISHGNKNNYSFDSQNGFTDSNWWNVDNNRIFAVAHSCFSAVILSQKNWKDKFKDWVGSTDKVWYCLDSTCAKIWSVFFKNLSHHLVISEAGINLKSDIEDIYFDSMYESGLANDCIESFRTVIERNLSIMVCKSETKD